MVVSARSVRACSQEDHPSVVLSVSMSTVLGSRREAPAPEPPPTPSGLRLRGDLVAVAAAAALVAAACLIGWALIRRGVTVLVGWPPLLAEWMPHVGPGTVPAVLVALLVALGGPALAARMPWRPLLAVGFVAALAWTLSLALIDGWVRGVAERLATDTEYLQEVGRTPSIREFLTTFASRIVSAPGALVTHASGHPPLATLIYIGLDRIGLGGGAWAGFLTLLVGASAVVPVAITLGLLADRDVARRYLPFGVLLPGAVWVGVSADGLFAAVLAWAVAFLTMAAVHRGVAGVALGLVAGLLFGAALFLSYGLVLAGLLPVVVLVLTRRVVPVLVAVLGVALVVAAFYRAGFWWLDGYEAVKVRYYQPGEYGLLRPFGYWVWGEPRGAGARDRSGGGGRPAAGGVAPARGPDGRAAGGRRGGRRRRRRPVGALQVRGGAYLAAVRDVDGDRDGAAAPVVGEVVAARSGGARADRQPPPADHLVGQRTASRRGSVAKRVIPSAKDTCAR